MVTEPLQMFYYTDILIITPLFTISPQIYPPPFPAISPTYLYCDETGFRTDAAVRLGMGGVSRVPLTYACTPVSTVDSVLSYIPAALDYDPVTLAAAAIVAISLWATLSMTSTSAPLAVPIDGNYPFSITTEYW